MTKRLESATVTSPPGATILDMLAEQGKHREWLARMLGANESIVIQLLKGDVAIDKSTASLLARKLGGTIKFWLARERNWQASRKLESATVTRGGKRKGAGRPTGTTRGPSTPAQIKRAARKGTARGRVPQIADGVNCTVRLPAEWVALFDAHAAASEVPATRADAIRDHLAWSIANRPGFMNKKT